MTQEKDSNTNQQPLSEGRQGWYGPPPTPPNPWDIERRVSLLEQSTKTIKEELSKINGNVSKLVWIVLTAVVMAAVNIVLGGNAF